MHKRALIALIVTMLLSSLASAAAPVPASALRPLVRAPRAQEPTIPWVARGDETWKQGEPTFALPGKGKGAWVAVSDQGLMIHVVAQDKVHVGSHGGRNMWKNDCLRLGIDAWGDGAQGHDPDDQFVGYGDVCINYALSDEGPLTWVEVHSLPAGFGMRPDLPARIVRDDQAGVITYDILLPWPELTLNGPTTRQIGIAMVLRDREGEGGGIWTGTEMDSWDDRPICGVCKPGKFAKLTIEDPEHQTAAVSLTHYMLNDAEPAARATLVWTPDGADAVRYTYSQAGRTSTMRRKLPDGSGAVRAELSVRPGAKLTGPAELNVELLKGDRVVASDRRTLRGDYRSQWYTFEPKHTLEAGPLGMADWLHAPAGKHGPVKMVDDRFEFADGTKVKFWGMNIGNRTIFRGHSDEDIVRAAKWYRKYGVNCLRFHKMWSPITTSESMLEFDPEGIARWDHAVSEFKKQGIYTGLSMVFRPRIPEGDRDMFLAYDEIMKPVLRDGKPVMRRGKVRRRGHTIGFRMFARDVQDWHIKFQVNLLNHVNPHTGLPLAKDPALAFVELHNEDSLLFYTAQKVIDEAPTYRKLISGMFSDWLKEQYGTDEALFEAWGAKARNAFQGRHGVDENLAQRNIYPIANPWYLNEGLSHPEHRHLRRRYLDTARFLYETQLDFYTRFIAAIRETGYQGPIVGSCWQAGSGVPHFYNLHTDYLAGFIDRHEYYGGGGWGGRSGFTSAAMLSQPGSGSLSEGFNQVVDRPFALSEWIGVNPYPWAADGVPTVAAYGLGLQGWDASYHFACGGGTFTEDKGGRWNTRQPTAMGQYPVFARMVYRGDVKEAPIISRRKVHVPSLREGRVGFEHIVETGQTADFNLISGDVPTDALAAGRVVTEFTDEFEPTEPFDISKYRSDGVVSAVTGQLKWHSAASMLVDPLRRTWREQQGFFTIDTPGTQAVVGFAPNEPHKLSTVTITPRNLFAVVGVTARSQTGTLASDKRLLLSAMARTENTGAEYYPAWTMNPMKRGSGPVRMEPVRATVRIDRPGQAVVHILDHDGNRTGRTLEIKDRTFHLDTGRDASPYYEIVYED